MIVFLEEDKTHVELLAQGGLDCLRRHTRPTTHDSQPPSFFLPPVRCNSVFVGTLQDWSVPLPGFAGAGTRPGHQKNSGTENNKKIGSKGSPEQLSERTYENKEAYYF